jgi:hypothetical protein
MYTEHVSKNGTGRGDQGRKKKKEEKTANYNKVHHICAGTRHKETHRKLLNSTGWGEGEKCTGGVTVT